MEELAVKISEAELEVLQLLWEEGTPLPVNVLRTRLAESRGWEATTVKTLVNRLVQKGVLAQEKRNVFYYSPLLSKAEYDRWATGNLIKRLYRGSARNLVAALVSSHDLTRSDIEELRSLLDGEEQP